MAETEDLCGTVVNGVCKSHMLIFNDWTEWENMTLSDNDFVE